MHDKETKYSKNPDMPENSLNLLLRRADWRFLLFKPYSKKSICFSEGALASAVELISETVIDPDSGAVDCELAVAANPDQATLHSAWSALKPGGSCYIEWNVNPLFNPKSINSKLEAQGFDMIALYLPKPSPDKTLPSVWIPLEDTRSLDFFISESQKYKSKNIFKYLGIILRSYLWSLIPILFIRLPWLLSSGLRNYTVCSIAHKTSRNLNSTSLYKSELQSSGSSEVNNNKQNIIQDTFNAIGHKMNLDIASVLMLTGGSSIYNKAILLVFTKTQNMPAFIIKIPRNEKSAKQLSIEADTLRTLQEKYEHLSGIPKLLYSDYYSKTLMVAESFISGTPIENILSKNNFRELATKGTNFLIELAVETKTKAGNDSWDKLVKPIRSDFITNFSPVLNPELIRNTIGIVNGIELTELVCEHTDFSPWNILIGADGELGVLDWENSKVYGLPLVDLIYFLTYLSTYLDQAFDSSGVVKSYRAMLDETTFTGKVYKECITKYCVETEIPTSSISSLRLLTWLNAINWRYDELCQQADNAAPEIETIQDIVELSLWEVELVISNQ